MSPINDSYKKKGLIHAKHHIACQDVEHIISKDDILDEYKNNIMVVDEVVPNGIISTGLRDCISRGLSVKYLTGDEHIEYIQHNGLYIEENKDDST